MKDSLASRDANGRLLPGHTAAPAGKPRRKRIPVSQLREVVGEEAINTLLRKGMEMAIAEPRTEEGTQWAFFYANKLVAPAAPQKPCIELDLSVNDNPVEMAKSVMHGVAEGRIAPDTAQNLIQALGALNAMVEIADLATEVEGLKALLAGAKTA